MEWSLEPNAEREYLLLWLDSESDAGAKNQVVAWVAGLLQNPMNRGHLEDPEHPGVYSMERVPGTKVGLVWTLKLQDRQVVLAHAGEIPGTIPPP